MVHGARPLFSLLIRDGPQLRTPQNLLSHPRSTCHPHGSWLEPPQSPKPDMDHSWIIVEDLVVTPSDSVRSFAEDSVATHAGSEAVGIGLQSIAVEYGCGVLLWCSCMEGNASLRPPRAQRSLVTASEDFGGAPRVSPEPEGRRVSSNASLQLHCGMHALRNEFTAECIHCEMNALRNECTAECMQSGMHSLRNQCTAE